MKKKDNSGSSMTMWKTHQSLNAAKSHKAKIIKRGGTASIKKVKGGFEIIYSFKL